MPSVNYYDKNIDFFAFTNREQVEGQIGELAKAIEAAKGNLSRLIVYDGEIHNADIIDRLFRTKLKEDPRVEFEILRLVRFVNQDEDPQEFLKKLYSVTSKIEHLQGVISPTNGIYSVDMEELNKKINDLANAKLETSFKHKLATAFKIGVKKTLYSINEKILTKNIDKIFDNRLETEYFDGHQKIKVMMSLLENDSIDFSIDRKSLGILCRNLTEAQLNKIINNRVFETASQETLGVVLRNLSSPLKLIFVKDGPLSKLPKDVTDPVIRYVLMNEEDRARMFQQLHFEELDKLSLSTVLVFSSTDDLFKKLESHSPIKEKAILLNAGKNKLEYGEKLSEVFAKWSYKDLKTVQKSVEENSIAHSKILEILNSRKDIINKGEETEDINVLIPILNTINEHPDKFEDTFKFYKPVLAKTNTNELFNLIPTQILTKFIKETTDADKKKLIADYLLEKKKINKITYNHMLGIQTDFE